MDRYILKRITWYLPTLLGLLLMAFSMQVISPSDPVNKIVAVQYSENPGNYNEQIKTQLRKQLGLDLPLFYIRIVRLAESNTFYRLIPAIQFHGNNRFHRWLFGDGNWLTGNDAVYTKGILHGDFGRSFLTGRPVSQRIFQNLFWSSLLAGISILISYFISIPLGIAAAWFKDSKFDRITRAITLVFYSLPVFWMAVLLLWTFSNPDHSLFGFTFPASGVMPAGGYEAGTGFFRKLSISTGYLFLPIICYSYGSIAFLSRITRASMLEVLSLDFIKTAKAKGLPGYRVVLKHAFRNGMIPIVTLFGNIFPVAVSGSVIIETVFSIPGMGNEIFHSLFAYDFPFINGLFLVSGLMTITGFFISDLLVAWVDPRIRFSK